MTLKTRYYVGTLVSVTDGLEIETAVRFDTPWSPENKLEEIVKYWWGDPSSEETTASNRKLYNYDIRSGTLAVYAGNFTEVSEETYTALTKVIIKAD